uniref:Uncharacterized protein n=1 Tax=Panagrolaimus davidi TaxID=227884 RepID=A0A914P8J8_9BILA
MRSAETHGIKLPVVTPEKIPYVKIDKELSIENDLWPERINFWNTLAEDFGFDWPSGISTANPEKNILQELYQ